MPGVLAAAGRDVKVLEQGNDVGGRIRTDSIDGFLCDRGFQVLNPAYPELHRAADISARRLQPFGAGVAVRREHSTAPPESATRKHAAAIMGAEPRPWKCTDPQRHFTCSAGAAGTPAGAATGAPHRRTLVVRRPPRHRIDSRRVGQRSPHGRTDSADRQLGGMRSIGAMAEQDVRRELDEVRGKGARELNPHRRRAGC